MYLVCFPIYCDPPKILGKMNAVFLFPKKIANVLKPFTNKGFKSYLWCLKFLAFRLAIE